MDPGGWRRWRGASRDERRAAARAAAAVRRRGALQPSVAALRVPLAATRAATAAAPALAHRWRPAARGARAPVAQRRSTCARVRLYTLRDAAARPGARPASQVGFRVRARAGRAEPR